MNVAIWFAENRILTVNVILLERIQGKRLRRKGILLADGCESFLMGQTTSV